MLRNLLILPDGSELFSGAGNVNAIQSVTLTECVNSGEDLTLGSVCADMVEVTLLTPDGGLSLTAGDEVTLYRVEDGGQRYKVGIFLLEKPTRPSAHTMKLTGYSRVTKLDKDLTQWLVGLTAWPYTLYDFANMVCSACGLVLSNSDIPNGGHLVQRFSGEGITGRQLMQWVGQIAGRFCRATADGDMEFAWYTPAPICLGAFQTGAAEVSCQDGSLVIREEDTQISADEDGNVDVQSQSLQITDDGQGNAVLFTQQLYYYQNGLSFEDYCVAPVEKVQLRCGEEDVGTVYPDTAEAVNTYIISGNYLLTANTAQELKQVARTLYEQLAGASYTPCKVSLPTNLKIRAGNTVQITDRNGKCFTAYVMTRTQEGQKDTLECTGSARRDSSSAVNNQSYKALTGKVLNIRADVEGLRVENKDMTGKLAQLELDLGGVSSILQAQEQTVKGINSSISSLEQTANDISAKVKTVLDDGVNKVTTEFGLTIDESAVTIHRSGSDITNELNEKGMHVIRDEGTDNQTTILRADGEGVMATDVSVQNYLIIGSNARIEDYNDGADSQRTACFWIGG